MLKSPQSKLIRLDHVGIIVRNIDRIFSLYKLAFGCEMEKIEILGEGTLKIAFIKVGDSWIELIQPLTSEDENAKFLEEYGEGLHHIAFEVEDINGSLEEIKNNGFTVIDDIPRPGANNATIAFLSNDFGGALIELVSFEKIPNSNL